MIASTVVMVNIAALVCFLVCLSTTASGQGSGIDLTVRAGQRGTSVVVASLQLIETEGVFARDNRLLRRIAYVETRDGLDGDTYREGYHGGIWQVDEALFNRTQDNQTNPQLTSYYEELRVSFGIDWPSTEWVDLRRPLFSAIGAHLYFTLVNEAVPMAGDLSAQGEYWKRHYNTNPEDTVDLFISRVDSFELEECPARGLDLAFVMDSSGSVGIPNFEKTKDFAASVVETFTIGPDDTRVGVIAFSGFANISFRLDTYEDKEGVLRGIEQTAFFDLPGGGTPSTNTADALSTLRKEVLTTAGGARDEAFAVPRVAIVITDGRSSVNTSGTIPAAQAVNNAGITVFAIGVGNNLNQEELNTIASRRDLVTLLSNFNVDEFESLLRTLTVETCRTPAPVDVEETIEGTLEQGEVLFAQYLLPTSGMTLSLRAVQGKVVLYADDTIQNPNAAFYDYKLETGDDEEVFIGPLVLGGGVRKRLTTGNFTDATIYISVEGVGSSNVFTLNSTFGDTSAAYMKHTSLILVALTMAVTGAV